MAKKKHKDRKVDKAGDMSFPASDAPANTVVTGVGLAAAHVGMTVSRTTELRTGSSS